MSDSQIYQDTFAKLLERVCTPAQVRAIESGASPTALWNELQESGFADILVAEDAGGAGLSLAEAFPLLLACGAHALPVPLAYGMMARAILAGTEIPLPAGSIALAWTSSTNGDIACKGVNWGLVADWVLVDTGIECLLLDAGKASREAAGTHGSLLADLRWPEASRAPRLPNRTDLRSVCAALLAAHIAGAMQAVLEMTVMHANERKQFGKSIGRFQAIQQQISVMAEQTYAARTAAQIGCRGNTNGQGLLPSILQAAVAKARSSESVVAVATMAHAVHGAIGVTAEFDLHLLTRRLHEWRMSAGSEGYWQHRIGCDLLAQPHGTLDFIRQHLDIPHP